MTQPAREAFPDQLEAAADNIDALSKQQISILLRRAAIRLRERERLLVEIRAEIAAIVEELPQPEDDQ